MRYAVIIAGGSGTRLWPLSRENEPKQLLPLIGGRSLLELAYQRLETVVAPGNRLICAAEAHRSRIVKLLGLEKRQYLGEPEGRDTLPALALSAAVIARKDSDAVIGVFTADHLIEPVERFRALVNNGFETVEGRPEALVTFGITPTYPATAYGYLELGEAVAQGVHAVRGFKEKPDRITARRYVQRGPGRYLWNSGMFVWKAATFLACLERLAPEVGRAVRGIAEAWGSSVGPAVLKESYPKLRKISVDYAIMEPVSRDPDIPVLAIPMDLDWRDIGSWSSYAEACPQDADGNAAPSGRSVLVDAAGLLLSSSDPEHLIAVVGCQDLIVVHTDNATLVCPKDRAQEIKDLQGRILAEHGEDYV
jgi:mannose-1-phosphate guanylyltransferase